MDRKKKDNLKKTKVNELKEVKMSYKIDTHDYQVSHTNNTTTTTTTTTSITNTTTNNNNNNNNNNTITGTTTNAAITSSPTHYLAISPPHQTLRLSRSGNVQPRSSLNSAAA